MVVQFCPLQHISSSLLLAPQHPRQPPTNSHHSLTPTVFFSSVTANFTTSPARRAPKCVSWRSPWQWRANRWIASMSSCMWRSGSSTCQSKRFFRMQWKKPWLLSGRKVIFFFFFFSYSVSMQGIISLSLMKLAAFPW